MAMCMSFLPIVILLWLSSYANAANFTFSFGTASQCDKFPVSWTGGTAPFELTLVPVFGVPQTVSIPSSSFSNGVGSLDVQLSFPQNQKMLAVMSDASGFATGGVSDVFTVGPSSGASQCNTTLSAADFTFDTPSALAQCRTYTFDDYTQAVQPVTIIAMIPGGDSFILKPPSGPTSFDWIADIASGTSLIFEMVDSKGRSGGSTQVNVVGLSDDATCLTGKTPTSVANPPSATSSIASSTSTGPASTTAANNHSQVSGITDHSSVSIGTIAGAVAGGVVGLGAITALILYLFCRRRRGGQYDDDDGVYTYRTRSRSQPIDLMHGEIIPAARIQPYILFNGSDVAGQDPAHPVGPTSALLRQSSQRSSVDFAFPNPYGASTVSLSDPHVDSESVPMYPPRGPSGSVNSSSQPHSGPSDARRKAAVGGAPGIIAPTRFILHTDAEEVIELPPQYDERLAPPSFSGSDDSPSAPGVGTYPPRPRHGPSQRAPRGKAPTEILEQDDPGSGAILQAPMSPGPPSAATPTRS